MWTGVGCRGLASCMTTVTLREIRHFMDRSMRAGIGQGREYDHAACNKALYNILICETYCMFGLIVRNFERCSGVMVRNFDSYAYACGLESDLGHCAYGTFGRPPALSFFVLSRQWLKMHALGVDVET